MEALDQVAGGHSVFEVRRCPSGLVRCVPVRLGASRPGLVRPVRTRRAACPGTARRAPARRVRPLAVIPSRLSGRWPAVCCARTALPINRGRPSCRRHRHRRHRRRPSRPNRRHCSHLRRRRRQSNRSSTIDPDSGLRLTATGTALLLAPLPSSSSSSLSPSLLSRPSV